MPVVTYTRFSKRLPADQFYDYLQLMPEEVRNKILRFRRWQDAHASLFGKLLLLRAGEYLQEKNFLFSQLRYNSYGRPFLEGAGDFNITHTDGLVACVRSKNCSVGIDVEKIRPMNLSEFTNIYTDKEWSIIHNSADPSKQFFHFWTRKEALIKADGRGMSLPLTDIEVINDEVMIGELPYFLQALKLDDQYHVHLATQGERPEVVIKEFSF